ncbi:MAG TPA: hypothetical protein VMA30_09215, partial [Xanthobacteraceae bacterium]|nr:hypothetical protein [Xanthobacteraceae bacterium]
AIILQHNASWACAMDDGYHLEAASDGDDADLGTPEDAVDRFGIRTALLVTCVGFAIAVLWLISGPSFQKCSGLDNLKDRVACYESVRTASLKPPEK